MDYLIYISFNLEIQVTLFHEKRFFVTAGWKVFLDAVWLCNAKVKRFIWLLGEEYMRMLHWGEAQATSQLWAPIMGLAVPAGGERISATCQRELWHILSFCFILSYWENSI